MLKEAMRAIGYAGVMDQGEIARLCKAGAMDMETRGVVLPGTVDFAYTEEAVVNPDTGETEIDWSTGEPLYREKVTDNSDLEDEPALCALLEPVIDGSAEVICPTGSMRLMYHDIGIVRKDKSLIRHRVFVTKLKPGCADEYKRRHDALIAARGDAVSEGPDSNFTIWYGAGYIFGYCEKVKAFDHEMTEQERADTVAWETRQLEIMDWLTDDVDWITGQKHDHIRRVV